MLKSLYATVADPGFPVGGGGGEPLGGGTDLRRGHFSVKMYAKTKELDPVWGRGAHRRRPPGSANMLSHKFVRKMQVSGQ